MIDLNAPVEGLVVRRTYPATRERLFALWTDPATLPKWFGPPDTRIAEARMEPHPGGAYRIVIQHEDGERFVVFGTYREVRPPERLVFSWGFEDADPGDTTDSVVTVEFNECAEGTELVLTHEKLGSAASHERHATGWSAILDRLSEALA